VIGLVLSLLLAALAALLVVLLARPTRAALQLLGVALVLGLAGYAWQGRPDLSGKPTPPRGGHKADDRLFAGERLQWLDQVGPDADLLTAADAWIRNGDPDYAAGILKGAVAQHPNNATLWIGLGNALTTYADGAVTPAARYAFARAAMIGPQSPAPDDVLGLALAQSGDLDGAEAVWRRLLARAPRGAPWRGRVEQKLVALAQIRSLLARGS
jgi:cytochrome c-type biogenesis protein CcmH